MGALLVTLVTFLAVVSPRHVYGPYRSPELCQPYSSAASSAAPMPLTRAPFTECTRM